MFSANDVLTAGPERSTFSYSFLAARSLTVKIPIRRFKLAFGGGGVLYLDSAVVERVDFAALTSSQQTSESVTFLFDFK